MDISKVFKRILLFFLISALFIPMVIAFSLLFAIILGEFGDFSAKLFFEYFSIGLSFLWGISLLSILILLAVDKLLEKNDNMGGDQRN